MAGVAASEAASVVAVGVVAAAVVLGHLPGTAHLAQPPSRRRHNLQRDTQHRCHQAVAAEGWVLVRPVTTTR